jgi:hypothetical protein
VSQTALVIHGHFYQPPRENPWTEAVPVEVSAEPFHDWNERITAECYRPNGWARVLDEAGRVVAVVNNYEHLSFNVGPTLMSWLADHAPAVLARMTAADATGGGALAQAYSHLILPLADERDTRTQVRWGLAEFEHRFGRRAAGIWLPETAVDDRVLAVLAEEGVEFTVLAPWQASAVRPIGSTSWTPVEGSAIDTRRSYRWTHPDGERGVTLVFYDGALSHDVAFGSTLSSEAIVERALASAGDSGGLVCVATDGETFGHHHKFVERGIAYALTVEADRRGVTTTNLNAWVREHPPAHEVRVSPSSWSCMHGIERWRADCGCHTGGDPAWNQRWRAPLREALDGLRDAAVEVFERRGAKVFADPWTARDAYIDVVLGRQSIDDFIAGHATGDEVEALTLLEAQRHAMLMYTSCGWFFNDLAGLETVQVLRYAARLVDLLAELGETGAADPFLAMLDRAESNDPAEGTGRQVWERHVVPHRVDAGRVVAHLALVELLESKPVPATVAGYDVLLEDHTHLDRGGLSLCAGRLVLSHRRTRRRSEHVYAALALDELEVFGAAREVGPGGNGDMKALTEAFSNGERVTALIRTIVERFGPKEFDLTDALPDAAHEILASRATALAERFNSAYERLYTDNRAVFSALASAGFPLPPDLRAPAQLALARRFEAEIVAQGESWDVESYRAALAVVDEAGNLGLDIGTPQAAATIGRTVESAVLRAVDLPAPERVEVALDLVRLAAGLQLTPDLDVAQEAVYGAMLGADPAARAFLEPLGRVLGLAVDHLGAAG